MCEFFITVTQENDGKEVDKKTLVSYEAKLDMWSNMAYFVARELHMRPYTILTEWSCEELLVAYGEYANIHSAEAYESRMVFFRKNEKPRKPSPDEKWAVIFLTREELEELNSQKADDNNINLADLAEKLLF